MKLGPLIDKMHSLREQKRAIDKELKPITAEMEDTQMKILEVLTDIGTPTASGTKATARITETTVAQVDDWAKVEEFIKDNDALYLMERRISNAAFRELLNLTGEEIPGIKPYNRITLNLRSI